MRLKELFTLKDCVFLIAVASVFYGLWQIHFAVPFIIVGGYFVFLTTYGRFTK